MQTLVYSPLLEEEEVTQLAWDKATLQYAINNRNYILRLIRSIAKMSKANINTMDVEDIYSASIDYLYKTDDYDIERATDITGGVITLEKYVHSCVRNCVKRYITETYRREKELIKDCIVDDEGKEREVIDSISDEKALLAFDNINHDVDSYLKVLEPTRYKYNIDIFLLLYIRLLTMGKDDVYINIIEVIGISKKELSDIEKKIVRDTDICNAIKILSSKEHDRSHKYLEKYVYSANKIKQTIERL